MDKYRIYIDESGHANMNSAEIPNERFLSLTGVIIKIDYVNNFLHNDMENLKKRYFSYNNRNPVIFHRKEIVNQKGSFKILLIIAYY